MALETGYEYTLTQDNRISGWKQHNLKNRPELSAVPAPTADMQMSLVDAVGNYKFQLINNNIIDSPQIPTDHQTSINEILKTDLYKIVKALVNGIETNGDGTAYQKLKNIIDKIQNGF